MNYSIIYKIIAVNSDLGNYLKVPDSIVLPFYVLDSEKTEKQLHRKQLLCGILIGYKDEQIEKSKIYFPLILQYLKQSFNYGSREKLLLDAVRRIKEKSGNYTAYLALNNAIELLPNRTALQYECAMSLYDLMKNGEFNDTEKGKSILNKFTKDIDIEKLNQNLITYIGTIKSFINIEDDIICSKNNQPSLFVDKNGEPTIHKHSCTTNRIGKEMTSEEQHQFAVELLACLYTEAGMTMVNVNRNYHREFPNLVMESKSGKLYYVIIETACYPQKAESLYSRDFKDVKIYAKEHCAIPTFAGISFMNFDSNAEKNKMICGDSYFVFFKGLEAI